MPDESFRRPPASARRRPSTPDDGTLSRCDALRILDEWMQTDAFPDRMFGRVPAFRRGRKSRLP